jgi:hypothetical protein
MVHKRRILLSILLAFLIMSVGKGYAADPSVLLMPGKTHTGTISNLGKAFKGGLPTTQDVTVRVEKISGKSAEVYVSWSKTSRDTGNAGEGRFTAEMVSKGEAIELSGQTGKHIWKLIFKPDGTVDCSLNIADKMVSRSGELK